MKRKIVAIGGGDFKKKETLVIDKEIITLSGKVQPKMLFIPTASSDNTGYAEGITQHYRDLGCTTEILYLITQKLSPDAIKAAIFSADIIYVGGGNTLKMMTLWRRLGVDTLLDQARQQGKVLCGLSAGSICWFNHATLILENLKIPTLITLKLQP